MKIVNVRAAWMAAALLAGVVAPARAEQPQKDTKATKGERGKSAPDTHLPVGERAFNEEDFLTAVTELGASMQLRPTAKAAALLGSAHFKLEQFDEARAAWQQALRLEKKPANKTELTRLLKSVEGLSSAKLLIDSQPQGATIYLDMKAAGVRGKTPLTLSMRPGKHRVFAVLEGYDDASPVPDPVAISGKTTDVMITLLQKGCQVVVNAKAGQSLDVSLDGQESRALPTTVRVPLGQHRLYFRGRGLTPRTRDVECKDYNALPPIEEGLDKLPNGILAIKAKAEWFIIVDETRVSAADAANWAVPPGEHRVQVQEAGMTPWHAVVTVAAGQILDVVPEPRSGQEGTTGIKIEAPPGSRCFLDANQVECNQMRVVLPRSYVVEARARGAMPYLSVEDVPRGDRHTTSVVFDPRRRWPLLTGVGLSIGAAVAAGFAGYSTYQRFFLSPSDDHALWQIREVSLWATAGVLGAAAIGFFIDYGLDRSRGLEVPPTAEKKPLLSLLPAPLLDGGALVLSGAF